MKIEDLKAHCVEQMRKLPKTSKMYEEHLLTLAVIDTNKKYFDEIEKKDKQIDLMAEVMFKNNTAQLIIEYGIENKEQIIKEFEKLVKEKGEEYARNKI